MTDYKGIEYLRNKLRQKRPRVLLRYDYYDMKNVVKDFGISTPPDLRNWISCLGWCGKGVDKLADRLVFKEFKNDNFGLNEIFQMNNPDILYRSAINGALITSCDFIYISPDKDGFPRMHVIDGGNATGIIDQTTGLLKEGYAVLDRNDYGQPLVEAYFTDTGTQYVYKEKNDVQWVPHNVGHPLLVPIIYKPDEKRPFGHARISRAWMSLVQSAVRTIKRSEIAAEFYSYPQKYVTGLDENAEKMEKWKATISSMMEFYKDEDGDKPTVGQFQQQSMTPHTEQLKMFASLFANEADLTFEDMGFQGSNPSSADAIKAAHENMRLTARAAQRSFASGFLNAGYLAACLRDDIQYKREVLYMTKARWEPIFEPDASMLSAIGDGVMKLNQAIPGFISAETLSDLTGIDYEGE